VQVTLRTPAGVTKALDITPDRDQALSVPMPKEKSKTKPTNNNNRPAPKDSHAIEQPWND
jgi:hypothetical protein